jgi:hypothetical protein
MCGLLRSSAATVLRTATGLLRTAGVRFQIWSVQLLGAVMKIILLLCLLVASAQAGEQQVGEGNATPGCPLSDCTDNGMTDWDYVVRDYKAKGYVVLQNDNSKVMWQSANGHTLTFHLDLGIGYNCSPYHPGQRTECDEYSLATGLFHAHVRIP